MAAPPDSTLELRSVATAPESEGVEAVQLHTDAGTIDTRYHAAATGDAAVLWVFGAGGGLGGPAGGLYPRLAGRLAPAGIASLRLDYRRPAELLPCVLDVLIGVGYLARRGRTRIVLVGHSFGGAVAIAAGAASGSVIGVAALSSQTAGAEAVDRISPRPLLLMHGSTDEVLPDLCSRELYRRAGEPKTLRLYKGCRHGLDQCREEIDRELSAWILDVARDRPKAPG